MSNFITQEDEPTTWEDKRPVPGQTLRGLTTNEVWRASEANTIKDAITAAREVIRGRSFHVENFGAEPVDGYVSDVLSAFNKASAAAAEAGGGIIEFTAGVLYDTSDTIENGVPFVDPDEIEDGVDFSAVPSFDSTAFIAARAYPNISIRGNGCIIRGNFSSLTGKAIFADFIADSHAKPRQDKHFVSGITIVGKEGYSGSPPSPAFTGARGALSASNHQVGYFSVLSSARLEDVEVRECDRGILTSDCYSSVRTNITSSHCNNNFEFYQDNGSVTDGVKSLLCEDVGVTISGASPMLFGLTTEQNHVDLNVPSADGLTVMGIYIENTNAADTGWGVNFGDVTDASANQVIGLSIIGPVHCVRQHGDSFRFQSTYAEIFNARGDTTGALLNNAACQVNCTGYPMPFDLIASHPDAKLTRNGAGVPTRLPKYETGAKTAIPDAEPADTLYDSQDNQINVYNGTTWDALTVDGSLSPTQYGATGANIVDDTTGLQQAINYANIRGKFLRLPNGTYRISSKLVIQNSYGFNFLGSGRDGCILKWIGSSGQPMVEIVNSQHVNFGRLQMVGNTTPANRPEAFIQSVSDTSGTRTYVPTNNIFRDLLLGTGTANESNYGIKYINSGTSSDTNNSEGVFENVKCQGVVEGCIYLGHAQSKAHHFRSCEFTLGKYGIYQAAGSFTWHGGNVSAMTVSAFYLTSANDCITVKDCTSETCDRFFVITPAGNAWTIQLLGNRVAADAVNADKRIIQLGTKGPNVVKGNSFDSAACKIASNWQTAGGLMVVEDNSFNWVSSNVATIFEDANQVGTWVTDPNAYLDAGGLAATRALRVVSTGGALHGNEKAALELSSTTKGFMPPRMTTTQRNNMSLGAGDVGMEVMNISTNKKNFWNGAAWEVVTSV